MANLTRLPGESELRYMYRVCSQRDAIGNWNDVTEILNAELGHEYGESAYRKPYTAFENFYNEVKDLIHPADADAENIFQETKRELELERIKLQTEKLELSRMLREQARDDLILERIVDAVKAAKPPVPNTNYKAPATAGKTKKYVLCFGDEHYGAQFEIRGLKGEVINAYSPAIFYERMERLLEKTIERLDREGLTKDDTLIVYGLGDFCDGILRTSQLMKLACGVVESSVDYAFYISSWLNRLSERINVQYQMTYGNHSELRMLGAPKGTFQNDNTGMFVRRIIKTLTEGNRKFEMVENPTGLIYDSSVCGYSILGIHGEVKDMEKSISDFANTYNTKIDYLIGGHMHHFRGEDAGIDKGVINVPSIIGVDDYAMSLNKTSRPGALLLEFTEGEGLSAQFHIKL